MTRPPIRPPRFSSDKEKAATRAERLRFLYWAAVALPLILTVMLFGYTDQAPAWLRSATGDIDAMFGRPVLRLIALMAG